MSLLDDVIAKLVADGVGVFGATLFAGSRAVIPAGAGPFVSVIETGGSAPTWVQNKTTPNTQKPMVQVITRGSDYPTTKAKAVAAYGSLNGTFNADLSGTRYLSIRARQEPTDMGADATGTRVQLVFNVEIEKIPS